MPVTVKDLDELFGKDVFTAKGLYCGKVSDVDIDLGRFKVRSLVVETAKEGFLGRALGGKKGVIIPYPMVQAIGDIVIIKHIKTPELPEGEELPEEEEVIG